MGTSIRLTWDAVSNAHGYEIEENDAFSCQRGQAGETQDGAQPRCDGWFHLRTFTSPGVTSHTVTGLTPGLTYDYRVRSYRGPSGSRDYSAYAYAGVEIPPGPTRTPTPLPTPTPIPEPTATNTPTPVPTPTLGAPTITRHDPGPASIILEWMVGANATSYLVQQHNYGRFITVGTAIGLHHTVDGYQDRDERRHRVCSVRGSETACSAEVRTSPGPTPPDPSTPVPPTATPTAQPPDAQVLYKGTPTIMDWGVPYEHYVAVRIVGHDLDDFEFNLFTNPQGTGFYVNMAGPGCSPQGSSSTDWFKVKGVRVVQPGGPPPTQIVTEQATHNVYLVRCNIGDVVNTGMALLGRRITDRREFTVMSTGDIEQAWHRTPRSVKYNFQLHRPVGDRPDYIPARGHDVDDKGRTGFDLAVKEWHRHIGPDHFIERGSGQDVEVWAYWHPAGYCDVFRDDALACVAVDDREGKRPSVAPHIGDQIIWIPFPPAGDGTIWTNDLKDAQNEPHVKYYLPNIMLHELGHTVGMGHLVDDDGVMALYDAYRIVPTPTEEDVAAFQAHNEEHTH